MKSKFPFFTSVIFTLAASTFLVTITTGQARTIGDVANRFAYLPIIITPSRPSPRPTSTPKVNAPFFETAIRTPETAIFWFGKVNSTDNYADGRVGYDSTKLYIRLAAFDRYLWYDPDPTPYDLTHWDAFSLYLNLDGNTGLAPGKNAYRFIGQLKWWEKGDDWQAVYRGDGTAWVPTALPLVVESTWRGAVPNDNADDDRGWVLVFHIPFSSLGLTSAPVSGTQWGMALSLHDRDDEVGTPISVKHWPGAMVPNRPATWGQLSFGLPEYSPPPVSSRETITIRDKLNGKAVFDAHVGGHTTCGQDYGPSFFDGWGDANYAGYEQINIQNQSDVADWPCFSKYYVTFPLDSIPINKAILSAKLRIYQFGNSGQGHEPPPMPSLIQVLTVSEDWDEETITWNNAPLANENVSQAWVDPVSVFPGWPGVAREWDVSRAVSEAYLAGTPLRLALYSADAAQHSGKYFISSETGDWNSAGRPALEIIWGEP